ncbi:MAG: hypothetical protein IKR18_06760 [Bacteroidaceae bacterium]|nr:hypothetical protein [Bacteroidaceae bacterium]
MRILFLLYLLFVSHCVFCQTTDGSFVFPFSASDNKWKEFKTVRERKEALQIPETTLKQISTENLLEVCMDYPYIIDMLAYDNPDVGFKALTNGFNGYRELLERKNLKDVIVLSFIDMLDGKAANKDLKPGDLSIRIYVLSYILKSQAIFSSLDNLQKQKIKSKIEENYGRIAENPEQFGFFGTNAINKVYKDIVSSQSFTRQTVEYERDSVVYTPNGSPVVVKIELFDLSEREKRRFKEEIERDSTLEVVGEASMFYNCHAYAWHMKEGYETDSVWMPNPIAYFKDFSYEEVPESLATKAFYYNEQNINDSTFYHSAIKADSNMYISKWSYLPLVKHTLRNVLDGYGTSIKFYRRFAPIISYISNSGNYEVCNIYNKDSYDIVWSIDNPLFVISTTSDECSVTYTGHKQYEAATLTATIMFNNTVIKTLTKEIAHVEEILGNTIVCNPSLYSLAFLPDSLDVTWSVDNNLFCTNSSGKQCNVFYNGTSQYDVATLTATVSDKGEVIGTQTKRIVHHGSEFTAELWQDECITPNGVCPEKHLYIENGCSYLDGDEEDEECVDDDIDENTAEADIDYEGEEKYESLDGALVASVPIMGGADVRLESKWFDGMNITFSSRYAPIFSVRKGLDKVRFRMPDIGENYYVHLNAKSPGDCNNFTIRFLVEQMPYGVSGDEAIRVEFLGNQLQIMLDGLEYEEIGDGAIVMPKWNFAIYDVKREVFHEYGTIRDASTSVNLSGYPNGTYVIRAGYKDHTYSKKFTLRR